MKKTGLLISCILLVGTLAAYADGDVTVTVGGNDLTFERSKIALVKLHVTI